MREKRKFIRFEVALKVVYIVQEGPRIEKTGATKDICVGGAQLMTEERLKKGDNLELKILIPDALNPVHLNGVVLWSKDAPDSKNLPYSAGIEFGEIEEDNKNTFLRFLCSLMHKKKKTSKGEGVLNGQT